MSTNQRACLACKDRKVRCDRQQPCCAGCLRTGQECHFPQSPIRRHRPKQARRSERERRGQHQHITKSAEEPGCSLQVGPGGHKTRFLTASAWSKCLESDSDTSPGADGEGVRVQGDEVEEGGDDDAQGDDHLQPLLFGSTERFQVGQSCAHFWTPTYPQLQSFCQLFIENVDPVFKVLHTPSLHQIVLQAQTQPFHLLEAPCQALLISICCAVVHTLGPDQQHRLKDYPSNIKHICQRSVESALGRARLTQTNDIRVLQAFVLFLACVRPHGSHSTWVLVGLAIRISRALGLHCDGTRFKIRPLEVEMRRRLWWQLRVLDLRVSENCGLAAASSDFIDSDTLLPLNIKDEDLDSQSETLPSSREGPTEMSYSILRFELCAFHSKCQPTPHFSRVMPAKSDLSSSEKIQTARKICDRYILLFISAQDSPFYQMATKTTLLVLTKFELQMELAAARMPKELDTSDGRSKPKTQSPLRYGLEGDHIGCEKLPGTVFRLSINLVEDFARIVERDEFSKWTWHIHRKPQLHAVSSILFELCAKVDAMTRNGRLTMGLASLPERHRQAWDAIERLFSLHQNFSAGKGDTGPVMDRLLEKVKQQIQNKLAPSSLSSTDEEMAEFSSWFDSELARHQNEFAMWDDFSGLDGIFNS